jgi:hypothetical protein
VPSQPISTHPGSEPPLPRLLARRLRDIHRSAGWPAGDAVEIELLAAGLLERVAGAPGRIDSLRVTDRGLGVLAGALQAERARFDAHESLVRRVACEMQRDGRIAWRSLALRVRVDEAWVVARPDVYSVRHTTVEDYLASAVHEIKVRRADLLGDLRRPAKRAAYLQMAGACSYVLAEGIAEPEEIPPECGVILARRRTDGPGWGALEVLRSAPRRTMRLPFAAWMALARGMPDLPEDHASQLALGANSEEDTSANIRAGAPPRAL